MAVQSGISSAFRAHGGGWVIVQFPLLFLAYLLPVWFGRWPDLAELDGFTIAGILLLSIGLIQFAAGTFRLGKAMTPFPRPLKVAVLRTTGVYGLVRHPIYTGVLCMAIGWSLVQYSPVGLFFDVLLFLFFDRKAAREEQWLAERFLEYSAYRQRVKKLIPWIY